MVLGNWVLAQTGAAFATDPAILLKDWIKNNWETATNLPIPVGLINFDTKFARWDKYLHIIIEKTQDIPRHQILGNGRRRHTDRYRVMIVCYRKNARDMLWKIKERMDALIDANPTGLQVSGVDFMFIFDYQEIRPNPAYQDPEAPIEDQTEECRARFLIDLTYDKVLA